MKKFILAAILATSISFAYANDEQFRLVHFNEFPEYALNLWMKDHKSVSENPIAQTHVVVTKKYFYPSISSVRHVDQQTVNQYMEAYRGRVAGSNIVAATTATFMKHDKPFYKDQKYGAAILASDVIGGLIGEKIAEKRAKEHNDKAFMDVEVYRITFMTDDGREGYFFQTKENLIDVDVGSHLYLQNSGRPWEYDFTSEND